MKKYLISMNYDSNRQPSYVLTESDYDNNGFVDINVEDFSIDTREAAEQRKQELEEYARANGDNYTTFTIEEI